VNSPEFGENFGGEGRPRDVAAEKKRETSRHFLRDDECFGASSYPLVTRFSRSWISVSNAFWRILRIWTRTCSTILGGAMKGIGMQ